VAGGRGGSKWRRGAKKGPTEQRSQQNGGSGGGETGGGDEVGRIGGEGEGQGQGEVGAEHSVPVLAASSTSATTTATAGQPPQPPPPPPTPRRAANFWKLDESGAAGTSNAGSTVPYVGKQSSGTIVRPRDHTSGGYFGIGVVKPKHEANVGTLWRQGLPP